MMSRSTVAFFDLDYTLLDTSSGLTYVWQALRQRRLPIWVVAHIGLLYQTKQLSFAEAHSRLIPYIGRHGKAEAEQFFNSWIPTALFPHLTPLAKQKVAWHHQQGHQVVIVSASIEEIVRPIANHLDDGLAYLCTHLAVVDDRYTGELAGPACYGEGKVYWVEQWCAQQNLTLNALESYFYTDSSSDMPLLERVTHPIAVNPSRKLAKLAQERGWVVEQFY